MNRIYRLVLNRTLGLVQVVSELGSKEGRRHGRRRSGRGKTATPTRTPFAAAIALALGMMAPLVWTAPAQAAATPTIVPGTAGYSGGDGTNGAGGTGGTSTGAAPYLNDGGNGSGHKGGYGQGGAGGGGYGAGGAGGIGGFGNFSGLEYTYGGGGGGGGAPAVLLHGVSDVLGSAYYLNGGAGGNGGNAYLWAGSNYYGAHGGIGGGGGAGVAGAGFSLYATYGDITGGAGGTGGNGTNGATGGKGGAGIYVIPGGSGAYINNGSSGGSTSGIYGGAGGHGGAPTGSGGSAGDGIVGSNLTVVNGYDGYIRGGKGGVGYTTGGLSGTGGYGGWGIYAQGNSTIVNGGYIGGGQNGLTIGYAGPNYAVVLYGGNNTLRLLNGYSFYGNVVSGSGNTGTSGGDILELSGTNNATLAGTFSSYAGAIFPPANGLGSFATAPVFGGFQMLKKTGSSTWTITNTGVQNAIPNWDVESGILILATTSTFADSFIAASGDTLTFGIQPPSATPTIPGTDNGEIVIPGAGTATFGGESLTVNLAPGIYPDGVTYTLMTAGGGITDSTAPSVSFNPSLPSGMSCTDSISTGTSLTLTCATGGTIGAPSTGGGGGAFGFLSLFALSGLAAAGRARTRRRCATG